MASTSTSWIAPGLSSTRNNVHPQSSSSQEEEISLNIMGTVFKVKGSATIKDLKAMLCDKYGFPENHPEFFLAGQPLMDIQRLVDCGFLECTVDLVLKNIVGMKIFVKLPSSQDTIEIETKVEDTIRKIKTMIQAKEKIQPDQFTLIYDGKLLEEDMTLASQHIKNESTLYMVSAPKDILSISVKAPSGETFKFKVKPLFTVRDVKTIVESYTGCSVSDHILIYSGNELEDLRTLAFYDIRDESVLEVSPVPFQIFVKVCDGKLITIDVKLSDTVKEVKGEIFRKLNVSMMPFDFYKLVFRWEQLDEGRDLASYNIRKGSKLRLVLSSSVIIDIFVELMGTVALKVKRSETTKELKAMLCEKYGIPENRQQLFFDSCMLMDFQRLVDRGVQRDSTLQLVLQNIVGMKKIFVKLPSSQGSIEIEAKAQDTIRNVKDMIQAKKMIQLDQFTLVYDGQLLEEDSTLASLDIKNESIICMIPAPKDFLLVYVKLPTGETFKLKVRTMFTVSDVKTIVGSITGVSFGEQNLIYSGNVLEDLKTLAFYDIKDDSVIEISPRPFQIFVRVSAGKTITINAKQSDTVEEVKVKVFHKLNVSTKPIDFYPLLFDGKRLEKGRDLASYNIQKDSTLVLVLYPSSSMV